MCFFDGIGTAAVQLFYLLTISSLQRAKDAYIARLRFVGGMRRKAAQDDVVLIAELQCFDSFVRAEAIVDQDTWSTLGMILCRRVNHVLQPVEADGGISTSLIDRYLSGQQMQRLLRIQKIVGEQ